jgi:hypothetical protein
VVVLGGLLCCILLLAAALATYAWWPKGGSAGPPPPRTMVAADWSDYLFTGRDIDLWQTRTGQWGIEDHADFGFVLSGTGVVRRAFPALKPPDRPPSPRSPSGESESGDRPRHWRLSLSACLHEAEELEVHFGLSAAGSDNGRRHVLRVTSQSAEIGIRPRDDGPLLALASIPLSLDPARPFAITIERQRGHWFALVGARRLELVGAVPHDGGPELREIRLAATGQGTALFGDVKLEELAEPPDGP